MKKHYRIVHDRSLDEFENKVNLMINSGYNPYGPLLCRHDGILIQTMIFPGPVHNIDEDDDDGSN